MAISEEDWEDVLAHLHDVAETKGIELTAETFVDLVKSEWDNITNTSKMERKSLRRELKALRAQKTAAKDSIDNINDRIDAIQAILGTGDP